jgi:hypothetical protein
MEEILDEIKNKSIKTPKETTLLELYKQLGNYSSEEITKDMRIYLMSIVYNFDKLIYMNMKILAAALVMLQLLQLNNSTALNDKTFHKMFDIYIKKYFIPTENLNVEHINLYYQDIKLDIYRYIRNIQINRSYQ